MPRTKVLSNATDLDATVLATSVGCGWHNAPSNLQSYDSRINVGLRRPICNAWLSPSPGICTKATQAYGSFAELSSESCTSELHFLENLNIHGSSVDICFCGPMCNTWVSPTPRTCTKATLSSGSFARRSSKVCTSAKVPKIAENPRASHAHLQRAITVRFCTLPVAPQVLPLLYPNSSFCLTSSSLLQGFSVQTFAAHPRRALAAREWPRRGVYPDLSSSSGPRPPGRYRQALSHRPCGEHPVPKKGGVLYHPTSGHCRT